MTVLWSMVSAVLNPSGNVEMPNQGEETEATGQGQNLGGFLPAPSGGQRLPLLFLSLPQSRTEHWSLVAQSVPPSF